MFQEPPTDSGSTQAWLTFLGVVIAAIVPLWIKERFDRRRMRFTIEASDFEIRFALEDLVEIREDVRHVFASTKADRFLILKAENGKQSPKWATAIYEQHKGVPVVLATEVYKKIRIDDIYREMIDVAESEGVMMMHTGEMPRTSRLKAIYESEGVQHSNCYFLCRYPLKSDSEKWVVMYCTLATENEVPFTPHEETALELFADRLRGMFSTDLSSSRGKK